MRKNCVPSGCVCLQCFNDFFFNTTATSSSVAGGNGNGTQQKGVEERLRILLSLLESSKEDAKNGREDTLQYLSQLESVARRLKDQLLNDNISNDSKVSFISVSYFLENP